MESERATPSLHERLAVALDRCMRAQEHAGALIEESLRVETALHSTLHELHERRDAAQRAKRSETDRRGV
ncbi:MAG TPA: hypothetical protein VNO82_12305 [Solirubrobacteraceae bacterium]|nr:hypothetical protein [Solirubrobacteraceae bacterium]